MFCYVFARFFATCLLCICYVKKTFTTLLQRFPKFLLCLCYVFLNVLLRFCNELRRFCCVCGMFCYISAACLPGFCYAIASFGCLFVAFVPLFFCNFFATFWLSFRYVLLCFAMFCYALPGGVEVPRGCTIPPRKHRTSAYTRRSWKPTQSSATGRVSSWPLYSKNI